MDERKLMEDIEAKMTEHGLLEGEEALQEGVERPVFDSLGRLQATITIFKKAFNEEQFAEAALLLISIVSEAGEVATRFLIAMRMMGMDHANIKSLAAWAKKFKIAVR